MSDTVVVNRSGSRGRSWLFQPRRWRNTGSVRKEGRKDKARGIIYFVRRRDDDGRYEEPMYVREAEEGRGILTTVTVEQEVRISWIGIGVMIVLL